MRRKKRNYLKRESKVMATAELVKPAFKTKLAAYEFGRSEGYQSASRDYERRGKEIESNRSAESERIRSIQQLISVTGQTMDVNSKLLGNLNDLIQSLRRNNT